MKKYLLSHDLGTSGDKATLFSVDGELIGSTVASYDTHYFNDNWVEQDADDWWKAFCSATKQLIRESEIDAADIAGISFSGQMMGCLCVDRQGRPLRPSIIWADIRAQEEAAQVEAQIPLFDYYSIVGHRISASYGLYKLMWVMKHEPEIYEQTYKTLNAKDYIVFRLTGTFCTDYSDANGSGFFDQKKLDWSEELLALSGLAPDKLPDVKPSTFMAGTVTAEAAASTGLAEGTPVIIGAGDGVATNVGAGSIAPGKAFCSLGTSAWIASTAEQPLTDPLMRTVTWAHMVPGLYAPNGTMQYACGSYSWLKNVICTEESAQAKTAGCSAYDIMDEEAAENCPGSNGLIFLPYLIGERAPRWDSDAKGCFIGLKPETSRGDIIRSVMEGVTYNLALILDILRSQIDITELTVLGGGAKGRIWQQIMADVFDARMIIPNVLEEAGSMGAAVCAGVGAGIYDDFTAIDRFSKVADICDPDKDNSEAYRRARADFERYYQALNGSWR